MSKAALGLLINWSILMFVCDLGAAWQLRQEALYCSRDFYARVVESREGWMDVHSLPCDVHVPLMQSGAIDDPVIADNYAKSSWIEQRSWWFKKIFRAGDELCRSERSELVIEGLDVHADLFLNGVFLGHHRSAMYPFREDVRNLLKAGDNILVVRLTAGLEYYNSLDLSKISEFISCEYKRDRGPGGDERRVFVRKPQFVFGWDWAPRIPTCGIMGNARIEVCNGVLIRDARLITNRLTSDAAHVTVDVYCDNIAPNSTRDVDVQIELIFEGRTIHSSEKNIFARSGFNDVSFSFVVENPHLWWPNGMGAQHLYDVKITTRTSNGIVNTHEFTTGIRTISLNVDRIDAQNRMFAFVVNGVQLFAKGGNWVTPDSIYGRVTDEKYESLVQNAREANFNMLRVNGVNAYERDYFYRACDRHGILVWQDFAFACAGYPDEHEWFREEVRREVEYQTRRLRNHPCIALWCGNNESQHILRNADGTKPDSPRGALLYNYLMPQIVSQNSPHIPYWNASPYGGEIDMESDACGDKHFWVFMSNKMDERVNPEGYDTVSCKFVSEFGCIGPGRLSSIRKYIGADEVAVNDRLWKLHSNPFNTYYYSADRPLLKNDTLAAGMATYYADTDGLSVADYLTCGGLFQGMMLGHAYESMRCAPNNSGALSWSYCEAWGEVGWSIIDYFAVRKISYYFVKRALAHHKLVLRRQQGGINVFCLNDTADTLQFTLEYGYTTFDGEVRDVHTKAVEVGPHSKAVVVAQIPDGNQDCTQGIYFARVLNHPTLAPAILRDPRVRSLIYPVPDIAVSDVGMTAEGLSFSVSSDKYAHAVHFGFDDDAELSDAYFDLLPGETRRISVQAGIAGVDPSLISPKSIGSMSGSARTVITEVNANR